MFERTLAVSSIGSAWEEAIKQIGNLRGGGSKKYYVQGFSACYDCSALYGGFVMFLHPGHLPSPRL